jgi:hypothetical protein
LKQCGWLDYSPDLGYTVPEHAFINESKFPNMIIDTQDQWNIYVEYLANVLVKINRDAAESDSAFLYYDRNHTHFHILISNLMAKVNVYIENTVEGLTVMNMNRKRTASAIDDIMLHSDISQLAAILAGNIGRLLNYRFSVNSALLLSKAVLSFTPIANENMRLRATVEYALQVNMFYDYIAVN